MPRSASIVQALGLQGHDIDNVVRFSDTSWLGFIFPGAPLE
jgi:hypothetical protein